MAKQKIDIEAAKRELAAKYGAGSVTYCLALSRLLSAIEKDEPVGVTTSVYLRIGKFEMRAWVRHTK